MKTQTQRQKVLVIGHFNRANPGDEWMRMGMEKSLPKIDFYFWGSQAPTWAKANVFSALKHCDRVWFGPGAMLHDVPKRFRFRFSGVFKCLIWFSLSRLFGRPFAIVGAEVGPLNSRLLSWLLRPVLFSCYAIVVRDQASFDRLSDWGLKPQLSADFSLACPLPDKAEAEECIGVALFPHHKILHGEAHLDELALDHIAKVLTEYHQETQTPIRLLVMSQKTAEDDLIWNQKLLREMQRAGCQVELVRVCPEKQGLEFLGCKLLLAMRFHACLLGLRLEIPLLALPYHPKTKGLMQEFNLSDDCFDSVSQLNAKLLIEKSKQKPADFKAYLARFESWVHQVNR